MRYRNVKKAQTLILVVLFLIIAGSMAVTLAMILSTEFEFSIKSYNVELAFYAGDSGVARGQQLLTDDMEWDPPSPPGYLEETYTVPRTGGKTLYYRIYVNRAGSDVTMTIDSGLN